MRTLVSFQNTHKGETIIVCGCGASLNELENPEQFITIGVNDVGRLFDPTYLVVLNPRQQFKGDRFRFVETSRAKAIFTQLDLGINHPHIVRFKLGKRGGTDLSDPTTLPYTQNSPYVALCLAAHMGAKNIGLIGVDFTDNHFFAKTGTHPLRPRLPEIESEYTRLYHACQSLGIEVFNLSPKSSLKVFPKMSIEALRSLCAPKTQGETGGLRIVSYATTTVAGVPAILARCISACTPHHARCVWGRGDCGNGVSFSSDIEWTKSPDEAAQLLREADIIIVHNGKTEPQHRALISGKPVVTMAHNYMWNVDQTYVNQGFPGVVVGQYQATLPEFKSWSVVPNPVPLWEEAFQPGEKGEILTIAYTPSGKHECYSPSHRLYWHSKGYKTTLSVLDRLASQFSIRLEVIRDGQIAHSQALAMKKRAHIVIDECVTGSYHRCSLEGLAAGCVVVNGVGLLDGVAEVLHRCTPDATTIPFVHADLSCLEEVLSALIRSGSESLAAEGRRNREWMERHWDFKAQWKTHWRPVIDQCLNRMPFEHKALKMHLPQTVVVESNDMEIARKADHGLSVVVPFGGRERLPLLGALLCELRKSTVVDQVIIVELASEPMALDIAGRSASDYLFTRWNGSFDKPRALNSGSSLARNREILWCDTDLLFRSDFLVRALQEFRACHLDFFYPFSRIDYLNESDSNEILAGKRSPSDCRALITMKPMSQVPGGMGIVSADLLRKFGGMIEGFLGWGGEDNAWRHKASLIGKVGATSCPDQVVWHLYHRENSCSGGRPWLNNPHYVRNVSLLREVQGVRTVRELMRKYPPPAHASTPWTKNARIGFVVVGMDRSGPTWTLANEWSKFMETLYGLPVPVRFSLPTNLERTSGDQDFDVVVAFVEDETSCRAFARVARRKATITVIGCEKLSPEMSAILIELPCVLARTREQIDNLRAYGVRVWHVAWGSTSGESTEAQPVVVQPLSVVLGAPGVFEIPVVHHEMTVSYGHSYSRDPQELAAYPNATPIRLTGLSVVVPHAGTERLPILAASLANLAQCEGIDEIIVVEHGIKASARTAAERWGARYVFVRQEGPFGRARALNIGTALASYDFVMWKDGDLLLPPHFVLRARAEMAPQKLDFFLPYVSINCLTEDDSHEVMRGARSPADCKPNDIWRGGISNGGAGIVRAGFVDQFGGLDESFRGWGYEDWAWWHKARLLGRTAATHDQGQVLYHLYHPMVMSEDNRMLYRKIQAIRSAEEFLASYPPPRFASCPWPTDKRIVFVAGEPAHMNRVHTLTQILLETYGQQCEVLEIDALESDTGFSLDPSSVDALVVFEGRIAETLRIDPRYAAFAANTLVVVHSRDKHAMTRGTENPVRNAPGSTRGAQHWTSPATWECGPISRYAALNIVDPLSLLLARPEETELDKPTPLAVWSYWEGACPDWITACLSTFVKHAVQARILDPGSFDALRVHDRDIDLQRLQVAHRADYVRAYLLAHFGGLWIDADCLLMRSPTEIFERLKCVDFIAHRDRQGWFPNGFMAARVGSRIARRLYECICSRLREGGSLGWTSLGSEPLTHILRTTDVPWHELNCWRIQPICWSMPNVFFERHDRGTHESNFRSDALCYMLSNTEVYKYLSSHPEENLLSENTFFRFLLAKSLNESGAGEVPQLRSLHAVPLAVECIQAITPSCVLQIGTDSILWAALIRDWWAESMKAGDTTLSTHLEAIRLRTDDHVGYGTDIFDRVHGSKRPFPSPPADVNWCLIVFTTTALRQASDSVKPLLEKALRTGRYVFLPTAPDSLDDCISSIRAKIVREGADDAYCSGGLLLSVGDPLGLRRYSAAEAIFERIFRENETQALESLSGPGSTLAQTWELRQRLPLLLQHIGAKSLVDAGCGDFNWMQHVFLGLEHYMGIDIIPTLIMRNRERFGSSLRMFEVRDIMLERLPKSDVILCRDCLTLFSFVDIQRTLRNFLRSGARFILTTTFPGVGSNKDIETGEWRPLNFEQAPFHFPKPLAMINEKCTEANGRYLDKSLGLWDLSVLSI